MSVTKRNVRGFKTPAEFRAHRDALGLTLPFDDEVRSGPDSPLARPELRDRVVRNRFAILPMEGWDNTTDGKPTDMTRRRCDIAPAFAQPSRCYSLDSFYRERPEFEVLKRHAKGG